MPCLQRPAAATVRGDVAQMQHTQQLQLHQTDGGWSKRGKKKRIQEKMRVGVRHASPCMHALYASVDPFVPFSRVVSSFWKPEALGLSRGGVREGVELGTLRDRRVKEGGRAKLDANCI